jgi:negative regulator of sigma E activity
MFNKKTVTTKKAAANRANAKFSTGPRTECGKRASRLNAVKFGFFSEELIIPLCDGEEALEKYRSLLNGVQQDFQPASFMQTWFAEQIAETMWRFRRRTRAERGSSLVSLWDTHPYQKDSPWAALVTKLAAEESILAVLNTAWEEIKQTATLSEATHAKVAPLLGGQGQTAVRTPGTEKAKEGNPAIDNDFIRRLEERRSLVQNSVRSCSSQLRDGVTNAAAKSALPSALDTEKILRYENQMRKQLDWAIKGFYECQKGRRKPRSKPRRVRRPPTLD